VLKKPLYSCEGFFTEGVFANLKTLFTFVYSIIKKNDAMRKLRTREHIIEEIQDYKKDYVRVYKEMTVTFGEFFEVLKQLGFKDKTTATHFWYVKKQGNAVIRFPIRSPDDSMLKADLHGYSYTLFLRGDIENPDDLAKMIEHNRENAKIEMAAA
jgi:hypothetical protein